MFRRIFCPERDDAEKAGGHVQSVQRDECAGKYGQVIGCPSANGAVLRDGAKYGLLDRKQDQIPKKCGPETETVHYSPGKLHFEKRFQDVHVTRERDRAEVLCFCGFHGHNPTPATG